MEEDQRGAMGWVLWRSLGGLYDGRWWAVGHDVQSPFDLAIAREVVGSDIAVDVLRLRCWWQ